MNCKIAKVVGKKHSVVMCVHMRVKEYWFEGFGQKQKLKLNRGNVKIWHFKCTNPVLTHRVGRSL